MKHYLILHFLLLLILASNSKGYAINNDTNAISPIDSLLIDNSDDSGFEIIVIGGIGLTNKGMMNSVETILLSNDKFTKGPAFAIGLEFPFNPSSNLNNS